MDEWMGSDNQQLGVSARGKTLGRSVLAYNWNQIQGKGVFFFSFSSSGCSYLSFALVGGLYNYVFSDG